MSKLEDSVNEILGIEKKNEVSVTDFEQPKAVPQVIDETKDDIDNDYKYSRDNYYNLIDKGNEAIQGILDIAKEGQHPRAYEVAGQLISQVGQTVDKLQDLQKKLKDLKEVPNKTTANIKNALFVGSTNELQKMLNRKKEDEIIEGETGQPEKDNSGDK
jgi:FtsZ-binding cell division protein ZapB|tara:strand:- start:67 stop:543 length:477 start_codon:yes stop_codon:yes gene_type:complete